MSIKTIIKKGLMMLDKLLAQFMNSEITQQGLITGVGVLIMWFLRVLSETGDRSILSQCLEGLTCVFLGLAFLLVIVGLGFHPYLGYASGLFVGHLGAIRIRILAIRAFNRKL